MMRLGLVMALLLGLGPGLQAHDSHALIKGDFRLIQAKNGATVTQRSYRGKFRLVFFGFTHCPLTCPLGLQTLEALLRELGPEAAKFQCLFITIDPERDTPRAMAAYLEGRDPRIAGLTGSKRAIQKAMRAFRLEAERVGQGQDYVLEHPAIIYVMDKDGRYLKTLPSQGPLDASLKYLRGLLP